MDAPPAAVCRVCLAGDRNTYSVANTALEQTYDVVTGIKLQRAGRPTAMCCVCVSQLRRCRKFIQTARESNDALDRWYQNHTHTDSKLMVRPLFSLTKISPEVMDIWEPQVKSQVKQEPTETEDADQNDAGTFITQVSQMTEDSTQISDDDPENTQVSFDEDKTQVPKIEESDHTESSSFRRKISKISDSIEWVNVQDYLDADDDNDDEVSNDDIQEAVDDVGIKTAPGTSNVRKKRKSLDQVIPTRSLRSRKRIKLNQDTTDSPSLEQRRPITSRHCPSNTDTSSTPLKQQNMFSCSQCTYTTGKKWNFKLHLLTHTGEKPFMCDKCDYKCKRKTHLELHLLTHTESKPFMCNKCDYKCKRKAHLTLHLLTHTEAKPFMCDKCDYKCKQKRDMQRHFITHTGENHFMCDKCHYKCKWKGDMKKHMMTHTGANPFKCDKCDYKCKQKAHLKLHKMTHTGENPFNCDKCDYKCKQKRDIKRHLMTHTGANPFKCDKCDYKCKQKAHLKRHLITHT